MALYTPDDFFFPLLFQPCHIAYGGFVGLTSHSQFAGLSAVPDKQDVCLSEEKKKKEKGKSQYRC